MRKDEIITKSLSAFLPFSQETNGEGSGVEILINEPYEDGPGGGGGQYTRKIYHVGSHLPGWFRSILPKSALMVEVCLLVFLFVILFVTTWGVISPAGSILPKSALMVEVCLFVFLFVFLFILFATTWGAISPAGSVLSSPNQPSWSRYVIVSLFSCLFVYFVCYHVGSHLPGWLALSSLNQPSRSRYS